MVNKIYRKRKASLTGKPFGRGEFVYENFDSEGYLNF